MTVTFLSGCVNVYQVDKAGTDVPFPFSLQLSVCKEVSFFITSGIVVSAFGELFTAPMHACKAM